MDKLGMEGVEVELRDAYACGGGLHCCTADVNREGKCEDYFPKMGFILKEVIFKNVRFHK